MALDQKLQAQIDRILSNPELYPDEFKSWLPRFIQSNVNFQIGKLQLPTVESFRTVGPLTTDATAFSGTWVNFGGTNAACAFYKDPFNRVHLKGIVKSGTIGTSIFTLPGGYKPPEAMIFAVPSNNAFGVCTVNPDGTVVATVGSNVYFSLDGISFRVIS